jgi:hypothetical protein
VVGLLLAAVVVALAEMQTWTFQKSGKTIEGEVIDFAGDAVTMKLPDGKTFTVPIAYLTESNRVTLAAERSKQWKEVEVVRLEGAISAGRYKKCTVKGEGVSGAALIQFLPSPVEAILVNRNQQAARIADLSYRIQNWDRAVRRADAVTPTGAVGDPGYVDAVMAQRGSVNLAYENLEDAKAALTKFQAAYADYLDTTKAATIVKIRRTGLLYGGEPVWECPDPRKPQR